MSRADGPLVPAVTPELGPYFAAAKEGRLVVQRCTSCGELRFPPRQVCASCLATDAQWSPVSGRGEVYSFTWMHQVYHRSFARQVPYAVAVVRLVEDVQLTTNVRDCAKEELRVGLPVEVVFEERGTGVFLPQFRPAQA